MEDLNTENIKSRARKDKDNMKQKRRLPTALTVECGVCLGPAPDHLHFGARCCYSCRAFFRRTAPRSHSLNCRSSLGKCEISSKHKKCISCRYNKCLEIGMAPEMVQGSRKKHGKDDHVEDNDQNETEGDDIEINSNASTNFDGSISSIVAGTIPEQRCPSEAIAGYCPQQHTNYYDKGTKVKNFEQQIDTNATSPHKMNIVTPERNYIDQKYAKQLSESSLEFLNITKAPLNPPSILPYKPLNLQTICASKRPGSPFQVDPSPALKVKVSLQDTQQHYMHKIDARYYPRPYEPYPVSQYARNMNNFPQQRHLFERNLIPSQQQNPDTDSTKGQILDHLHQFQFQTGASHNRIQERPDPFSHNLHRFPSSFSKQYHRPGNVVDLMSYNINNAMSNAKRQQLETSYLNQQHIVKQQNNGVPSNSVDKKQQENFSKRMPKECTFIPEPDHQSNKVDEKLNNAADILAINSEEKYGLKEAIQETKICRPSVIKSLISSKKKDPLQLQQEADIMKFQGNILKHTGNLFNYHADLLEREREQSEKQTIIQKLEQHSIYIKKEDISDSKANIKKELSSSNIKELQLPRNESKTDFSEALADQMFSEAQDLMINSPWITNIIPNNNFEEKKESEMTEDDPLKFQAYTKYNVDVDSITDLQFTSEELPKDIEVINKFAHPEPSTPTSVIQSSHFGMNILLKR